MLAFPLGIEGSISSTCGLVDCSAKRVVGRIQRGASPCIGTGDHLRFVRSHELSPYLRCKYHERSGQSEERTSSLLVPASFGISELWLIVVRYLCSFYFSSDCNGLFCGRL